MNRREFVSAMAALGSTAALDGLPRAQTPPPPQYAQNRRALGAPTPASLAGFSLPRKADFAIPEGETYINSAYVHPIPITGREALRRYAESRTSPVLDRSEERR